MTFKVAFVSGRPADGTILPKQERFLWNEILYVLRQDLSKPVYKDMTFLIPVYSKFDLAALALAEKYNIKVEYYLPNESWGTSRLPRHQRLLMQRKEGVRHVCNGAHARMVQMIADADIIYALPETVDYNKYEHYMKGKPIRIFPKDKMRFHSEEEAKVFYDGLAKNMSPALTMQQIESIHNYAKENLF